MTSLVAVYTGDSMTNLELVTATSDPDLVAQIARLMRTRTKAETDPVRRHLAEGRLRALEAVENRAGSQRPHLVALPSA